MKSANLALSKKKHINFSIRHVPESPLFLIPTIYLLPKHDVNLEIEGFSIGFCFLRLIGQFNIRQSSWRKKSSNMDLVRANALAQTMRNEITTPPDAMAIVKTFDKNRWLKEIASRGVEDSHYGLRIIKEAAKDEMLQKDSHSKTDVKSGNQPIDLKIEGLD